MAAKKKDDDVSNNPLVDDIKKAKEEVAKSARAVGRAAGNAAFLERRHNDIFGSGVEDWDQTLSDVEDMDTGFAAEEMMNKLKEKFGADDMHVRVMQIGPNGSLVDVSDKVSMKDLRPEDIGSIQTEDGRELLNRTVVGTSRTPRSREAALALLSQIMHGMGGSRDSRAPKSSTTNSIRKMEETLKESEEILEHWKK